LEQRSLGRTGRSIPSIALGCVTFGREIDEDTSYHIMDYAMEQGITLFDTAEAYGGGQSQITRSTSLGINDQREVTTEMSSSENIVGRWMEKRNIRKKVTLITKFNTGGSADNVHRSLQLSLDRLRTDHVEIYKLHKPFPDVPDDETLSALSEEVSAGRVETIGCSQHSADQLRHALETSKKMNLPRYEIVQPGYNLGDRECEKELLTLCTEENISVTPFSPMGAGFFTGKYTPSRNDIPKGTRFDIMPAHADIYFNDRNFIIVNKLKAKADEMGIPIQRLAMAWTMSHPAITSVLVGARETAHIDNAIEAFNMDLHSELRDEISSWGNPE